MSPNLTRSTAEPTSITSPTISRLRMRRRFMSVRPSYMWRSEPDMFVRVMRTKASVERSILALGQSISRAPSSARVRA